MFGAKENKEYGLLYGLNVFVYGPEEKVGVSQSNLDAHFIEFVPFLYNQENQKTILE